MDATANLTLPLLMPQQAQKSVTHNGALEALDALVMLAVASRTVATPPGTPLEGDRYIVAASATGVWSGKDTLVAAWQNGSWGFFTPREGWLAWCSAEAGLLVFRDAAWQAAGASGTMDDIVHLGINTTADATNRLAVASPASLFTHDGSDHRLVVNKHATTDTASLLFQDDYSGRVEIGLAGDDHLRVKVSADGTSFVTAIEIDNTSGAVALPATNVLTDYALNLYQDSGRMAGNGVVANTIGAYSFPAYLTLYNGATEAAQAKFIFDNTDYGGSGGTLDSNVKDLIDKIRSDSASHNFRRYGPEFWVAKVTAGTGAAHSYTFGGVTAYYCLFSSQQMIPPAMTFHIYMRALTSAIIVYCSQAGQTGFKDGVSQGGSDFLIEPGDGWVSVTIQQKVNPSSANGYQPLALNTYTQAPGDELLVACPALMGGLIHVDDNVGLVPCYNGWSA